MQPPRYRRNTSIKRAWNQLRESSQLEKWRSCALRHPLAIAKRLGVSTDYLLTGERICTVDGLSLDEEKLLKIYRSLPDYQKGKCYGYMQGIKDGG